MIATLRKLILAPAGALLVGALSLGLATPAGAQTAPPATGSIHGHVTNPAGAAIPGTVKLTTDKSGGDAANRKYEFSVDVDASGDFKGASVPVGDYLAVFFTQGKSVDFMPAKVTAGGDTTVDFDMTRKEYFDKMSPEEKKAVEDFKKRNADANAANAQIKNLNANLTQARADIKAGNFAPAIAAMTQATQAKPDESILWITLGDAQLGDANAASKAAGAAGATNPEIIQKFQAAADAYQKGIDANAASKKPSPDIAGTAYNQLGLALSSTGKLTEASAAYDKAATASPAMAGSYYFNEAATFYNRGKMEEAAAAADKAIAVDPKKADAYYIKGQSLIQKATVDPKTQKIIAPPGCVEAYQMYLELAPDGPRAAEVTSVLQGIGASLKTSFKAGKKS